MKTYNPDTRNKIIKKYRKFMNINILIKLWQLLCLTQRGYKIRQYIKLYDIRKLQLGSGENVIEEWLNTDLLPLDTRIVLVDASDKLPFENNTFNYIFSEHLLEHFTYEKGYEMLQECYRTLRPGGIIRIATPDIHFLIELFINEKTDVQERYVQWFVDSFSQTKIYKESIVINNFVRLWGHQFIYDYDTLKNSLENIGFTNITKCSVGKSSHEVLQGLENHGKIIPDQFNCLETMVIEAEKCR